jgi:hypothetical protein
MKGAVTCATRLQSMAIVLRSRHMGYRTPSLTALTFKFHDLWGNMLTCAAWTADPYVFCSFKLIANSSCLGRCSPKTNPSRLTCNVTNKSCTSIRGFGSCTTVFGPGCDKKPRDLCQQRCLVKQVKVVWIVRMACNTCLHMSRFSKIWLLCHACIMLARIVKPGLIEKQGVA